MDGTGRRLAAIMFTDVAGYTALAQRDERLALELLEEHRTLIRPLVEHCEGVEVKTMGDGFLIEFPSALQAVRCAIEVQRALRAHASTQPATRTLRVRIGVHLADVEHREGDALGDGVNIASRIQDLAEPGGTCVSSQVYDQVENKLEVRFTCLGHQSLKHIARPVEVYRVIHPWEEPPPKPEPRKRKPRKKKPVPPSKQSIAVLPFANVSADPEQDYFAEGIAEELINALAHVHDLRVVARTSAFAFKGRDLDVRQIGRKLAVSAVLEGSVRKAENRLRITAQLVSVEDGFHLWSERYDRDMADIFAIQDEITAAIVDSLKVTLKVGGKIALRKRSTDDPEAYNLYLKGLYFFARPSSESYEKALAFFQAAIAKDPDFAQAYAGVGQILAFMGIYHFASPTEMLPKAKAALEKALSLDDDLAEAHAVSASLAFWIEWDWKAAERHFDRALALNPGNALAHAELGWFLATMKRFDEAIREIQKAIELDPLMPHHYAWSAAIHNLAGRYDEALQEVAKALEIDPTSGYAYQHVYMAHMGKGLLDEALDALEKAKELGFFCYGASGAVIYGLKGDREKAERLIDRAIEQKKAIPQVSAMIIALDAGVSGKLDLAFEYLDRAYEERDILMTLVHIYAESLAPDMAADPRFKALLAKMKLDF